MVTAAVVVGKINKLLTFNRCFRNSICFTVKSIQICETIITQKNLARLFVIPVSVLKYNTLSKIKQIFYRKRAIN
jgi:hypothetical protein